MYAKTQKSASFVAGQRPPERNVLTKTSRGSDKTRRVLSGGHVFCYLVPKVTRSASPVYPVQALQSR